MSEEQDRSSKADVIFHPVRIRVVQALFGGRRLTAQQLADVLGGPSITTLYRHLHRLVEAGVVAVVAERPMRGATEKVYALASDHAANFSEEESRAVAPDEQVRHFTTLTATLTEDFGRYMGSGAADPLRDGVTVRQEVLYLTPDEARLISESIKGILAPYRKSSPDASRSRYRLTTVVLPEVTATDHDPGTGDVE